MSLRQASVDAPHANGYITAATSEVCHERAVGQIREYLLLQAGFCHEGVATNAWRRRNWGGLTRLSLGTVALRRESARIHVNEAWINSCLQSS
jgi:hypothetical protein